MPTNEEIAAAISTLTTDAKAASDQADSLEAARKHAQEMDDLANAIEAGGYAIIGHSADRVKVSGSGAVAQIVTYLRARATDARAAIVLPG